MRKRLVGTSGWNYNHWKEIFYPEGLPSSRWLDYYTRSFNSVELNVTFYRLVPKSTFEHWHDRTPSDFHFVAKGSRFITHIKKIKSVGVPLNVFLKNASGLKEKLAAILWQFPSNFKKNSERLEIFLRLLARKTDVPQVFEFRHQSWFDQDIYGLLRQYNACLCIAHSGRYPCVRELTSNFLYLRFHGGTLYRSNYTTGQLKEWAAFAKGCKGKDIMAFFNNDAEGHAVKNALEFKVLIK